MSPKLKKILWIVGSVITVIILTILVSNLLAHPAAHHPFFDQFEKYPLVIAHADDTGLGAAPGDTLLFLEKMAELGVDVLEMGVDGIMTNQPELLMELLGR